MTGLFHIRNTDLNTWQVKVTISPSQANRLPFSSTVEVNTTLPTTEMESYQQVYKSVQPPPYKSIVDRLHITVITISQYYVPNAIQEIWIHVNCLCKYAN